jgi:hypothetical protein
MSDTADGQDNGDANGAGAREPEQKDQGLGKDSTIPNTPDGVGVGAGEPTTFEPEEDPEAARDRGGDESA